MPAPSENQEAEAPKDEATEVPQTSPEQKEPEGDATLTKNDDFESPQRDDTKNVAKSVASDPDKKIESNFNSDRERKKVDGDESPKLKTETNTESNRDLESVPSVRSKKVVRKTSPFQSNTEAVKITPITKIVKESPFASIDGRSESPFLKKNNDSKIST